MKVLFQAPLLNPTWKGFISNILLNELYEEFNETLTISSLDIPTEINLENSLGSPFEEVLDKTLLPITSSLGTVLETYDIQVLICDWKQAWNLLLPGLVNIVIGLDEDPWTEKLLANCYYKGSFSKIQYNLRATSSPNQFNNLNVTHKPFKFIFPESFLSLDSKMISNWIDDSNSNYVFYYPEPYCNPQILASVLNTMELNDVDIDIVASYEELKDIYQFTKHENCSRNNLKLNDDVKANLVTIVESITRNYGPVQ